VEWSDHLRRPLGTELVKKQLVRVGHLTQIGTINATDLASKLHSRVSKRFTTGPIITS